MKILCASCEHNPYIKFDGVGDVVLFLGAALKKMGHDVCIVLPKYGFINYVSELETVVRPMIVHMGYRIEFGQLLQMKHGTFQFISLNSIGLLHAMRSIENLGKDIMTIGNTWHSFAGPQSTCVHFEVGHPT
jgi:glycogen synthase